MAQIFKDVSAAEAGVTATPAPEVTAPEPASTSTESSATPAESAPSGSADPSGESQAVAVERHPQRVSWSRYETLRQEHAQAMSNMETMQQRLEQLESKLTQQVVQADPQAAAPKSGETQSDWLQRLLDEGEEVNPKLVEQIRSLENKLNQMNQSVQMHNQRWQNVEWAQANAAYDQSMSKLQSYCPKWDEERLTTMIANGVPPRMVVAMYRDVYGDAPSQQAPAQVAQVQRAAPPRIDGPSNSTPNIGNETMTKENYLKWVRGEFNNKMH
jgi:hypothetical protein